LIIDVTTTNNSSFKIPHFQGEGTPQEGIFIHVLPKNFIFVIISILGSSKTQNVGKKQIPLKNLKKKCRNSPKMVRTRVHHTLPPSLIFILQFFSFSENNMDCTRPLIKVYTVTHYRLYAFGIQVGTLPDTS